MGGHAITDPPDQLPNQLNRELLGRRLDLTTCSCISSQYRRGLLKLADSRRSRGAERRFVGGDDFER